MPIAETDGTYDADTPALATGRPCDGATPPGTSTYRRRWGFARPRRRGSATGVATQPPIVSVSVVCRSDPQATEYYDVLAQSRDDPLPGGFARNPSRRRIWPCRPYGIYRRAPYSILCNVMNIVVDARFPVIWATSDVLADGYLFAFCRKGVSRPPDGGPDVRVAQTYDAVANSDAVEIPPM